MCEDPIESALFIIIIILGPEHRWCEDPLESALFYIIIIIIIIIILLRNESHF